MTKRTRYSAEFKARVALDAIREELTLAELSRKHSVHANMISGWNRAAIRNMAAAFGKDAEAASKSTDADVEKLHAKIGQLVVERDFLKRAFGRYARSEGRCASKRKTSG